MPNLNNSKRLLLVALTAGLLFIIIPAVLFASSSDRLDDISSPADRMVGQTIFIQTPVLTDTNWLPIIQKEVLPTSTPTPTPTNTPTPSPTPSPSSTPDTSGCLPNPPLEAHNAALENELADAINSYRAENGKGAYTVDNRLVQAARRHVQDMPTLSNSQISSNPHMGSDGTLALQRIDEACYETNFGGEIVVYGSGMSTVDAALNWWKNSTVHNDMLLDVFNTLDDFGPTYAHDPASQYKHYWTVTFGDNASQANRNGRFYCTHHVEDREANRGISVSMWQETPCRD